MDDRVWTETVRLSEVARGPVRRTLEPDEAARRRIAALVGVDRLDALHAEVVASSWLDGAEVRGRWNATVEQTCGVSLDPFTSDLAGDFQVRVVPAGSPNAPADESQEVALDLDSEDPPDVLDGDQIDLAGYVVEHLSLEVDPFPRKPGVEFQPPPEENPASPFAVLRSLHKDEG